MKDQFFMLEKIYVMTQIPLRYMNTLNSIVISHYGYSTDCDPILTNAALRQMIKDCLLKNEHPALMFEDKLFLYAAFKTPDETCIIAGPVSLVKLETYRMQKCARQHGIENDIFQVINCSFQVFVAAISAAYYLFTGQAISDEELLINSNIETDSFKYSDYPYQKYILDNAEEEVLRMNYADEINYVKQVRDGNVESIKASFNSGKYEETNKIGKLATDTFKHYEYMTCTALALMSRAAIEGGLDPLTAYAMSDTFLQKLEISKNINDIFHLNKEIRLSYALRVKKAKEEHSQLTYLELCKNYIARHLNQPIKINSIAEEIGINPSYLSRRFSKKEGISITHYIHKKRIEAASNMLKYSNKSISEIAAYLCFPSQSHFGKIFREHTGVSPQKFRNREKTADFKG